jgi:ParB-like chromosome segregation protein Spo0J
MNLHIDTEYKALIPPLAADELAQLEANILQDGCRDPIVVWEDTIIDGHNRYSICKNHGLTFKTVTMEFADRSHAKEWIIRNQFGRRNLAPYVRVSLALELESTIAARAKGNQIEAGKDHGKGCQKSDKAIEAIDTKREIAAIAGVSHDTVAKVKTIKAKASDEVKSKVASGEMSINKAYQETKEPPITIVDGTKYKLPKYDFSDAAKEKGEQAEKDSETLWLLKSTWRKATKKDKSAFLEWAK